MPELKLVTSESKEIEEKPRKITVTTQDGKKYVWCEVCNKNISVGSWRRHERCHRGEKIYSCPTCGLGFSDSGNLSRHMRAKHSEHRPYVCQLCYKTFSRNSHLEDHLKSHSESREFVCHLCGKASKSSAGLRMHKKIHEEYKYSCVECGARFKRRGELGAHVSVHTGERPHTCYCGLTFRLRNQLVAHSRTHAKSSDTLSLLALQPPPAYRCAPAARRPCDYCPQLLAGSYQDHLVDAHSDLLFHCGECDTYVARKDFILHMSVHAVMYADKPEEQKEVNKNDTSENDPAEDIDESKPNLTSDKEGATKLKTKDGQGEFSDHDMDDGFGPLPESVFEAIEDSQDSQTTPLQTSTDTSPKSNDTSTDESPIKKKKKPKIRTCPICAKVYYASSSYFYHMKYFHKNIKDHECDTCGRKFGTKLSLTQHLVIHTNEFQFQCKECHKKFRSKASLYIHEQTHNGVKTYACSLCDISFRWRTHLKRHMKRHSAEKAHICSTCGRGFSIRCDLLRHARTHTAGNHACDKCGAKFAQNRYLKVHMAKKHSVANGDKENVVAPPTEIKPT